MKRETLAVPDVEKNIYLKLPTQYSGPTPREHKNATCRCRMYLILGVTLFALCADLLLKYNTTPPNIVNRLLELLVLTPPWAPLFDSSKVAVTEQGKNLFLQT